MRDLKVYIFDLDGTLLDTLEDLTASVNYALSKENFPCRSISEIKKFVGNGVRKLIERAVPEDTKEKTVERVLSNFRENYLLHSDDKTQPYAGVLDMLQELKRQNKYTAVVSNKFDAATKELCSKYFGDLIDVAIGECENIARKPSPDGINEVMRILKVQNSDCIYIGDSDIDILAAQNSGLTCVSVTWGFREPEFLKTHGATDLIDSPNQLLLY